MLVWMFQLLLVHPRGGFGRRQWHPTPVLLPGKSHGWRSLVGCSPWGCWKSDATKWLPLLFSLSCTGGGNGNPLQCACLENPRDGGAWWAAVYGVAQSRTRLKRLSSSICINETLGCTAESNVALYINYSPSTIKLFFKGYLNCVRS